MYALYNKEKMAEADRSYDLIRDLRLIVKIPKTKITIYDNDNKLLISSKFYSKLDLWAEACYRATHKISFILDPFPSTMDDNDETEFYL